MKKTVLSLCLLLALLILTSCRSNQKDMPLKFGIIQPSIDHLPLDVALKNFYLDSTQLQIISFTSGWEVQEAITAGKIDIAIVPFSYAWAAVAKGYKLKIISCLERETDGIITSTSITDLQQLNKRKIGTLRASTIEILMQQTAKTRGFSYEPVYFRTPSEMIAALQSKDVDAIVCYVPLMQKMSETYHVLHWFAADYPAHPCCDLVVREEALKRHPKYIKDIIAGLQKASEDITRPDETVMDLMKKTYSLDDLQAVDALRHTVFNTKVTEADKQFEQQMMQFFLDNEYLDKLPSISEVFAD